MNMNDEIEQKAREIADSVASQQNVGFFDKWPIYLGAKKALQKSSNEVSELKKKLETAHRVIESYQDPAFCEHQSAVHRAYTVGWIDARDGTPCEQVRHAQEIERFQAKCAALEETVNRLKSRLIELNQCDGLDSGDCVCCGGYGFIAASMCHDCYPHKALKDKAREIT